LVVKISIEYDGPNGHYRECHNARFIHDNHAFMILGADCQD
jgi:hypothetical protein